MLNTEVDKIGIEKHIIGRAQLGVVFEVHADFLFFKISDFH